MINARTMSLLPTRLTTRLIIEGALARNWEVLLYTPDSAHIRLQRTDGVMLEIYSSIPATTSFVAARLCDDKYLTHLALQEVNLPVLETHLCNDDASAQAAVESILQTNDAYVVKPLDASHGDGVTVNLQSVTALVTALEQARLHSPATIIQAYQPTAIDLRVVCIGFKYVAALERIPARIKADGKHTIAQLIELENVTAARGDSYTTALTTIPVDRAVAFLGEKTSDIPPENSWVQVLGTANVGTGGETRDVTAELPAWLITMAEKTARTLNLPICGVDFLVGTDPKPELTPEQLHVSITEVNKGPSLFIHERPNHGVAQPVIKTYLDYLESLPL